MLKNWLGFFQQDLKFPTVPISEPITLIKPVPFPAPITDKQALDVLESRFGQLFTKESKQVDITKTLAGHAQAFYGSGQDVRIMQDYQRWLADNRTIVTKDFLNPISL